MLKCSENLSKQNINPILGKPFSHILRNLNKIVKFK
jgi:hypothetical protein